MTHTEVARMGPLSGALRAARRLPASAVAAGAGLLLATAFAPLEWWPLALVCPALLIAL